MLDKGDGLPVQHQANESHGMSTRGHQRVEEKLLLRVLHGHNLRGADRSGLSDPYCLVKTVHNRNDATHLRRHRHILQTPHIPKTTSPPWYRVASQPFDAFNVYHSTTGVQFQCWDKDILERDDCLGKTCVSLAKMKAWTDEFARDGRMVRPFEDDRAGLSDEGVVCLSDPTGLASDICACVREGDNGLPRLKQIMAEDGHPSWPTGPGSLHACDPATGDSAWSIVAAQRSALMSGSSASSEVSTRGRKMMDFVVCRARALSEDGKRCIVPAHTDTVLQHGFTRKRVSLTEAGIPGGGVNGTVDPSAPQVVVFEYKFVTCDEYRTQYLHKTKTIASTAEAHKTMTSSSFPGLVHPPEQMMLIHNIGVDGWDGTEKGEGDFEHEDKLSEIFSRFGTVEKVSVFHRVQNGRNTSWALVTMQDAAAVDQAVEASLDRDANTGGLTYEDGTIPLKINRCRWKVKSRYSEALPQSRIVQEVCREEVEHAAEYPSYQYAVLETPRFYPDGTYCPDTSTAIRAFLSEHSSWRVAIQTPWDFRDAATWQRPTFTTLGVASTQVAQHLYPDPYRIAKGLRQTKAAPLLGVLTVTVASCHHLPQMDHFQFFGKENQAADPYVVCGVGNYIGRTPVHQMTQNPEWTRAEGELGFPVTAASDELHVMVFDYDRRLRESVMDVPDDIVGRIWPPVYVRDLEYGIEREFELNLHDVGDCYSTFDYSTANEIERLQQMGTTAAHRDKSRGKIRLKIRFDLEPIDTHLESSTSSPSMNLRAWRKVLASYTLWPRIPSKPIEIMNDAVRHKCAQMPHIPESSYKALKSGFADEFDLNYTMDLKQSPHPKHRDKQIGRALPYAGMGALKTNGTRIQASFTPLFRFAKEVKVVLAWRNPPRSLVAMWCWSYLLFYPGLILPSLLGVLLLYMGAQGVRRYRQRQNYVVSSGIATTADDNDEIGEFWNEAWEDDGDTDEELLSSAKREWQAWEERRLWKAVHAPALEHVEPQHKWEIIAKWVSQSSKALEPSSETSSNATTTSKASSDSVDVTISRSAEECEEHLREMVSEFSSDDDTMASKVSGLRRMATKASMASIHALGLANEDDLEQPSFLRKKTDKLSAVLRFLGHGDKIGMLQSLQNGSGVVASALEKLGAILVFEDPTMSCALMMVLSIVIVLLLSVPFNYIVWAIGMKILMKKSPLMGLIHEAQRRVRWLPNPKPTQLSSYWYRMKYANRKKYGPLPPEKLSSKLEMPLNFIWHAPSRARLGSRYRHEEHKLIEGFEDWAKHRATSLTHSQHNQQLETRNLNNHNLFVRHLSKDAVRKALKASEGKAD